MPVRRARAPSIGSIGSVTIALATIAPAVAACGKKHDDGAAPAPSQTPAPSEPTANAPDAGAPPPAPDAGAAAPAPPAWPELAELTGAAPWRIVELPIADPAAAPTSAGGPLISGDVAVVATARAGFVGVDLQTAAVLWSRRAGPRVAPPAARGDRVVLAGDCPPGPPPTLGRDELAVGCFDIVDPVHVADERAGIVHGPARALAAFARASGPELTTVTGDGALLWRRGDVAIRVDLASGAATAAATADVTDHVDVDYHGDRWTYTLDRGALTGALAGARKWSFPAEGAVLVGAFNATPPQIPLVRLAGRGRPRGDGKPGLADPKDAARRPPPRHGPGSSHDPQRPTRLLLLDVDGIEGNLGQVSHSFPGVAPLASVFGDGGASVLVVRLDDTATRDYVAAFDGNGLPLWAWPLPEPPAPRVASPGLGLSDGYVVVLFDDRVAIIPLVSPAPTAPAPPSRNPTP